MAEPVRLNFRLRSELHAALKAEAKRRGKSMNRLMCEILVTKAQAVITTHHQEM